MTTSAAEPAVLILSADDLKAIRQADGVSFHHGDGAGRIVCTKRVRNPGPFDEHEKSYRINCASVVAGRGVPYRAEGYTCFASRYSCAETWRTIAGLLRKGDQLRLRWSADGESNGYLERSRVTERDEHGSAGLGQALHADALYLEVMRGDGSAPALVFLLDVRICPDNTARMVRAPGVR
jgi:hypothetical protein